MKKGFTLVELMGVLIIIGLLCLIIIPITANILKSEKEKQYERQITTITLAAKNLVSDNLAIVPKANGEHMYITVGQLKSLGYLEDNLINPVTEKAITDCARVKITKVDNSYEYVYDQATEEDLVCNLGTEDIQVTSPTVTYIKKGEIASYIVSVNQDITQGISEYEIDQRKIVLTGTTDSTIGIIEGTGIYKITVRGGDEEGEVGIKLESGAIIKNKNEDIVGASGLDVTEKIIVDNTAPQIVFGTNGNSSWAKSASSTVTVTDSLSGGATNSYKFVYTKNVNTTPSTSFNSGSSYSQSSGTGDYYLIASACDRAGNCTKNQSNVFKLDNTGPTLLSLNNPHSSTWSTTEYYTKHTGKDDHSGIKYWQYAIENGDYITDSNAAYNTYNTYNAYWVQDRNSKVKIRACDYLDNCSTPQETTIKIDKTAPVITLGTDGNSSWAKSANSTITVTDNLSGGVTNSYKYVYTTNVNTTPSTSFTSGSSYSESAGTGDYYLIAKACDQAGNCNTKTSNVFKLDNTGPVITGTTNSHSTTWSTVTFSTIHTATDNHSGIAYWQYSNDKVNYITDANTASGTYNAEWVADRNYEVGIRACDYLNNCSTPVYTKIMLDATAPQITGVSTSSCASGGRTITINASDVTSGISGYTITNSTSKPSSSSFTSITSSSWTSPNTTPGTYYAWVKDNAGNISSYRQVTVASCFTPTDICNTKYEELFGGYKGAITGNYGTRYTNLNFSRNWCYEYDNSCNPNTGYDMICITDKCREYGIYGKTSREINTLYNCSFAKYWCSCTYGNDY